MGKQTTATRMDGFGEKSYVKKMHGKWQGVVPFFEYAEEADAEDGNLPVKPKKVWHTATKLFDIPSYPDNNRGKKAAEDALNEWRKSLENKTDERTAKRSGTVHEITLEAIRNRKSKHGGELAPHTRDDYMRVLRYIDGGEFPAGKIDGIGSIRVEKLTKKQVSDWAIQMQNAYSAPTVRKALMVLRDIGLEYAVQQECIERNPAVGVTVSDVERAEPNYLTGAALHDLVAALSSKGTERHAAAVTTALFTGLREGELCGLTWADVSFEWGADGKATGGTLTVHRVIARSGNGFVVREKPKNRSSKRTIPLGGSAEVLGELYKATAADYARNVGGSDLERHRAIKGLYVFGRIDGRYLNPRMLWKYWKRLVDELGLVGSEGKPPTFHDLRHTFATVAVASGVGMNDVQKILGHSNISTTMDIYAATEQEALQKASSATSAEIRRRAEGAEIIPMRPTGTDR